MRNRVILIALALGTAAILPDLRANVVAFAGNEKIEMVDDCDPNADWGPGGCIRRDGSVSRAEFMTFLASPLSPTNVGHPSWRMDPGYLTVEPGFKVKLQNVGGRNHTFTRVAQFGGGTVPPLRVGLTVAPECNAAVLIPPGEKAEVSASDLHPGDNRFQCCFHSWMHGVIKVVPDHNQSQEPKQ